MREFGVAEASGILAIAFAVSAMLGAVRQALLNARFGAGDTASAYYAAARLPETLFTLVSGGALWSALIPILLATRKRDGDDAARRLADIVLGACLLVSSGIIVIGELSTPLFVSRLLVPGFDAEATDLTIKLTRIMLFQPLLLAAGAVAVAVLNARNRFLIPALAIAIHNLAEISGILVAWAIPDVGIYGPTFGALGGALLQGIIPFVMLWRSEWRPRPAWRPRDPGLRAVVRLLIPNGLSLGVGYLSSVVETTFASRADEHGALPAIISAWLLAGLPVRLLGFAAGQAVFPRLANAVATEQWTRFRRLGNQTLLAVVALSIPVALGLVVLARPVVRILFEHGEFDADATRLTARLVLLYAIGLPTYIATEVLTRSLIALHDTRTPLLTNTGQLAIRVVVIAALFNRYGVEAIPVSYVISSAIEVLVLLIVLRRKAVNWQ
jgi:putative peptidoglycan lipid II flippase